MSKIVVAVDFSDVTPALLNTARRIARQGQDALYLLHVEAPDPDFVGYNPGPQHVRDNMARSIQGHHALALQLRDDLLAEGFEAHCLLIQGVTHEKILEEAARLDAAFIVLGRHGHGALYHLLMGSVSEAVLRLAKQPVILVPNCA
ncbi:MAG: universal stress protein [Candidatus Hydrogenedentes bacterium]|nr:universal stress protein [Candidatus Hydrogenedentota bacterium]